MKLITCLMLLCFSFNSFALFGLFEKKVDPRSLVSFEDRMNFIMQDPQFKAFYQAEKKEIEARQEKLNDEWKKIEEDISQNTNYSAEQLAKMKEQRQEDQKKEFERKLETMKAEVLANFAISPEGEVVNIKEYEAEQEKKRQEKEALRRLQQFQSEEGLPISRDVNDVRFNTK